MTTSIGMYQIYKFYLSCVLANPRFATDVIMRVAYGHQITHSDDDPYVGITQRTSHVVGASGSPGSTPVDFFPFRE